MTNRSRSTAYRNRPNGTDCRLASSILTAALVPILIAIRLAASAPDPRLPAAPSPIGLKTSAFGDSRMLSSCVGSTPHAAHNSRCQVFVCRSYRPVALAIELLVPAAPKISAKIQSAGETQRSTFRNNARSVRRSHRSFAGQKEARSMHPVRPWIFLSSNSSRSRFASGAERESAHIKIGVNGRAFRSRPSSPCQNALPPIATLGFFEWEIGSVSCTHARTARSKAMGESSGPPSVVYRSAYSRRASLPGTIRPRWLKRAVRVEELPISTARTNTLPELRQERGPPFQLRRQRLDRAQ